MSAKAQAKVETATAFIHGRTNVTGKGENAKTVTSVKFDKVLGNLGKLGIKIATLYSNPDISGDIAGYKVEVTPVTQADMDKAMKLLFG